jgi:hypothetical protein
MPRSLLPFTPPKQVYSRTVYAMMTSAQLGGTAAGSRSAPEPGLLFAKARSAPQLLCDSQVAAATPTLSARGMTPRNIGSWETRVVPVGAYRAPTPERARLHAWSRLASGLIGLVLLLSQPLTLTLTSGCSWTISTRRLHACYECLTGEPLSEVESPSSKSSGRKPQASGTRTSTYSATDATSPTPFSRLSGVRPIPEPR